MKVIFLDIDGVLNNWQSMHEGNWVNEIDWTNWDTDALVRLSSIATETGAKIVISSTWRKIIGTSIEWWNEQFFEAAAPLECVGITGSARNGFRGREVADWVENCPGLTAYVILDDDSDFYEWQPRVHTPGQFGLLDEHITEAVRLLNGGEFTPIQCMEELNVPSLQWPDVSGAIRS